MKLETFFTEDDVREIYDDVVIYSILKYQRLDEGWQLEFSKRYRQAQEYLKSRGIRDEAWKNVNFEQLKLKLSNYQKVYNSVLQLNQTTIEKSGLEIERFILKTIEKKKTELEKVSFLFDFVTRYVTYSEDYFHYCLEVPPVDGFTFDFKNCIPVDSSIYGMLVIGQGVCDDISNLLCHLGRKLQLDITKVMGSYRGFLHSFNGVNFLDGTCSFMDATRLIRGDKEKEGCFLVSQSTLNKDGTYGFREDMVSGKDYKGVYPNFQKEVDELIANIQFLKPQLEDLNGPTYHKR